MSHYCPLASQVLIRLFLPLQSKPQPRIYNIFNLECSKSWNKSFSKKKCLVQMKDNICLMQFHIAMFTTDWAFVFSFWDFFLGPELIVLVPWKRARSSRQDLLVQSFNSQRVWKCAYVILYIVRFLPHIVRIAKFYTHKEKGARFCQLGSTL